MLDTPCSEVVCKTTRYPLHSHVSPSLPLPCVTVCHQASTELYLHTRPSHKFGTTSVSWYNTTTKRVKRNIQPPRATLTALPRQERCGVCTTKSKSQNFELPNECPKLTAYSCTGHLLRLTRFLHTVTYGTSVHRQLRALRRFALRWFECLSHQQVTKIHSPSLCTTLSPLHPLMAANTQTKAVHYVDRKCRRVPSSLPAGTTFEPASTARLKPFDA
jgi:hypothetical protein